MKLYDVIDKSINEDSVTFTILLNSEHCIYKAHFPGYPVTPGACIVQIAVDLLGMYEECHCELVGMKGSRFLSVLKPDVAPKVQFVISRIREAEDNVSASILIRDADTVYAKMECTCRTK